MAQALRARVMPLFAEDPLRIPDIIGAGPDGSYIRILRSDSAVLGGRQFATLIFGEERREQPHPWERLVPRR